VYESNYNGNKFATTMGGNESSAAFARTSESERAFTVGDLARVLLTRLWVILLVVSVVVGIAVGVSFWQTPEYVASTKVLVGQEQGTAQDSNLGGSVTGLQALTQTMILYIDTRPVAEEAIQRLGLNISPDDVLNNLTIEQMEASQMLLLSYKGSDPKQAEQIVNTVGQVSSERISTSSVIASNIEANVAERAIVPEVPVSPQPLRNGLLAAVFGLMLGTGLALLMEYLDYSWRSPEEVEQISGVPTFATIPEFAVATRRMGR
jgi:capsular polysaccharide biosynthesis protein